MKQQDLQPFAFTLTSKYLTEFCMFFLLPEELFVNLYNTYTGYILFHLQIEGDETLHQVVKNFGTVL